MGTKGNDTKKQSINFDRWMVEAIEEIASVRKMTFTSVVFDLLRQELAVMGYTTGIGRESVNQRADKPLFTNDPAPAYGEKIIDFSRHAQKEAPMDTVKFMGWDMLILPYVGKVAAGEPIDINAYTGDGVPFPRPLLKGSEKDYFVIKIEGTSMTSADTHTGDIVVIRRAEEPVDGKIMLVRYENSSTLKRIKIKETKKEGRRVYLHWEDGSGNARMVDSTEYEIQGEFYRNLGK